jgi:uncharacterized protein YcfJ
MKKTLFFLSVIASASLFADGFTATENVKVTRSEPVYKNITTQKPIRECWDETQQVTQGGGNDIIGGLVGGAIGGALGSQVGKGSGKTAATIGGAIVGAMVGEGANRGSETSVPQTVQKCKTTYQSSTEQVLSGYNNYAIYQGKQIVKFSNTPLTSITVYTNISY